MNKSDFIKFILIFIIFIPIVSDILKNYNNIFGWYFIITYILKL